MAQRYAVRSALGGSLFSPLAPNRALLLGEKRAPERCWFGRAKNHPWAYVKEPGHRERQRARVCFAN